MSSSSAWSVQRDPDKNFRSFYNINTPENVEGLVMDPRTGQGWTGDETPPDVELIADVWKVDCSERHFRNVSALSGGLNKEDGQDLNNESCDNVFEGGVIEAGKGVAITCKGGSSRNEWRNVVIRGRGRFCEIEFGNHSDQSWKKCVGNRLVNMTHEDGRPVRVAYGRSDCPVILGGNVQVVRWWSCVLWAYTWAKHLLPFIP